MRRDELLVIMTPEKRVVLNETLLVKQGVEDNRDGIIMLHRTLDSVLANPEEFNDPVALVENLEYLLQLHWNFPEDRNFHIHWPRLKGCTCPFEDNRELAGMPHRIISGDCPWHNKGE